MIQRRKFPTFPSSLSSGLMNRSNFSMPLCKWNPTMFNTATTSAATTATIIHSLQQYSSSTTGMIGSTKRKNYSTSSRLLYQAQQQQLKDIPPTAKGLDPKTIAIAAVSALAIVGGTYTYLNTGERLDSSNNNNSTRDRLDSPVSSEKFNDHSNQVSLPTSTPDNETDPYENLPEEDEETTCSMCKTFRQGPCRPYWRKLERCFKDHENEADGATLCLKYFTPHHECLSKYSNVYRLISLDMDQHYVQETNKIIEPHERLCWGCTKSTTTNTSNVRMDWGQWPQFATEMGLDYHQTITPPTEQHQPSAGQLEKIQTPLWKRFPEHLDPVLITATAHIPQITAPINKITNTDSPEGNHSDNLKNLVLKVAWVLDQDDMVVGFSFNRQYGALFQQSSEVSNTEEDKTNVSDRNTDTELTNDNIITSNSDDKTNDKQQQNENQMEQTTVLASEGSDDKDKDLIDGHDITSNQQPSNTLTIVENKVDISQRNVIDTTEQQNLQQPEETNHPKKLHDTNDNNNENDPFTVPYKMEFIIIPGVTKTVRVFALYAENPIVTNPEKDTVDVLLYHSIPYSMKKAIQETK